MALAQQVSQALDASGARVVILARAGQDLSNYGLTYSHLGLAYKTDDGLWRVVHKLNQCGSAVAAVYRQGLGEFFLDGMWRYKAAFVIPSATVQTQLLPVLESSALALQLHVAPYSVVSYAWGLKYQQSNQWAIETMASSLDENITNRAQAQARLRSDGYEPTALNLGPLTRLGGRMTAANIAFDDHPNPKRFADRIETVTVDSVFAWMARSGLGDMPRTIRLKTP